MVAAVHLAAAISFAHVFDDILFAVATGALCGSSILAVTRLRRHESGVWCLAADGGLWLHEPGRARMLRPLGSSTDFGWAVWLHWKDAADGRSGARLLTRDQFDPEAWRHIRVWLRHLACVGAGRGEAGVSMP